MATWRQGSLTLGSAPGPDTAGKYFTVGGCVGGGGEGKWDMLYIFIWVLYYIFILARLLNIL